MYAYIRGLLISKASSYCVVESCGIGYKICMAVPLEDKFCLNQELLLYTSFVVRENSQALYGFLSMQERDTFEQLLNASGVGPKLALSIIGHLTPLELQQAIMGNDLLKLAKIPGIGKKTAERLVIELKDRLKDMWPASSLVLVAAETEAQPIKDAVSALINLGYSQTIAQKAVKKSSEQLPQDVGLAALITQALANV